MFRQFLRSRNGLLVFLALYGASLLWLAPKLSLNLDEILDLWRLPGRDVASVVASVPSNAGGVPLNYLVRAAAVDALGVSSLSDRLPSAAFSLLGCVGVFILGRRFGLRWPLLAVVFFALAPLQFRYALEGRAYSQALCLTVWSTISFLAAAGEPRSARRWAVYSLAVILGLYSHPYTLFCPLAHLAWAMSPAANQTGKRRLVLSTAASISGSLVAFVPWYIYARLSWGAAVAAIPIGSLSLKSGLLILHELMGTGYLGAVLALGIAAAGLRREGIGPTGGQDWGRSWRWFCLLAVIAPIGGALLADGLAHYFLAVRQMIFALSPLALLFAAGAEARSRWCAVLAMVFLGAALYEDGNWVSRPREDWQAAAAAAATLQAACVEFVPADAEIPFVFFRPELRERKCKPGAQADAVVLAINPYDSAQQVRRVANDLTSRGLTKASEKNFHGPEVDTYTRTAPFGHGSVNPPNPN